jgi:hypothetical protein
MKMKLWLLRPIEGDALWSPWYDKAFGFVVRAKCEADARLLAHRAGGDEVKKKKDKYLYIAESAWSAEHSTCVELTAKGEAGIVIKDFAAA